MFIEHRGFDLDDPTQKYAFQGMGSGWRTGVLRELQETLAAVG